MNSRACLATFLHSHSLVPPFYCCLLLLRLLSSTRFVLAPPPSPTDSYLPPCPLPSDPPPGGYKLWSNESTWQLPSGGVPGVGPNNSLMNVTLTCGMHVLLDVPSVALSVLHIHGGSLKVLDSPSLPYISLSAHFIIVSGLFIVGESSDAPFSSTIHITLTPNSENSRADFLFTHVLPAEVAYPRSLGHKAFAVVGGQVRLFGMPSRVQKSKSNENSFSSSPESLPLSSSSLSWVRLNRTADAGADVIYLDDDVSSWPIGSIIAIASTDYDFFQSEWRTIVNVSCPPSLGCSVSLDRPLSYMHYGDPFGIPAYGSESYGSSRRVLGYVNERAEVSLLSRNIVISGEDEPAPYDLEGGHFIVFMTQYLPQSIDGVMFFQMGQQGKLGRYNIHFHLCGDQRGKSVVRRNAMVMSKQRGVVVHATFNLLVEYNVGFDVYGHMFMVEEGGETGNVFRRNVGMINRKAKRLILRPGSDRFSDETDDRPSTFWVSNPNNSYIENVAAGSENFGFWFELRERVRGLSLQLPTVNSTRPRSVPMLGEFRGNVAHSNKVSGFTIYPHGYYPRRGQNRAQAVFSAFTVYKNRGVGVVLRLSDSLTFDSCAFADNGRSITLSNAEFSFVNNSIFVGFSNNTGNCVGRFCSPAVGCTLPPRNKKGFFLPSTPPIRLRNVGLTDSVVGVVLFPDNDTSEGFGFNVVQNSLFSGFDTSCNRLSAAIVPASLPAALWNVENSLVNLTFAADSPMRLFLPPLSPRSLVDPLYPLFAIRDKDGTTLPLPSSPALSSFLSSLGVFFISPNNPFLPQNSTASSLLTSRISSSSSSPLSPSLWFSPSCALIPTWNVRACIGVCYRSIRILYRENGFSPAANFEPGQFSFLRFIRVSDGAVFDSFGNLNASEKVYVKTFSEARIFHAVLLANETYVVRIIPRNATRAAVSRYGDSVTTKNSAEGNPSSSSSASSPSASPSSTDIQADSYASDLAANFLRRKRRRMKRKLLSSGSRFGSESSWVMEPQSASSSVSASRRASSSGSGSRWVDDGPNHSSRFGGTQATSKFENSFAPRISSDRFRAYHPEGTRFDPFSFPSVLWVSYHDGPGCGSGLTLLFPNLRDPLGQWRSVLWIPGTSPRLPKWFCPPAASSSSFAPSMSASFTCVTSPPPSSSTPTPSPSPSSSLSSFPALKLDLGPSLFGRSVFLYQETHQCLPIKSCGSSANSSTGLTGSEAYHVL